MLNEQQFYLFGQIQTSQTGGQPMASVLWIEYQRDMNVWLYFFLRIDFYFQ